jgi:hypothetical protein
VLKPVTKEPLEQQSKLDPKHSKHDQVQSALDQEQQQQFEEKIRLLESTVAQLRLNKDQTATSLLEQKTAQELAMADQFRAFRTVVQSMIDESLERYAVGDGGVGRADYALADGGAHVLNGWPWTSPTYHPFQTKEEDGTKEEETEQDRPVVLDTLLHWFGLELALPQDNKQHPADSSLLSKGWSVRGPEAALEADVALGHCWPMQGTSGRLTVALSRPIHVGAISIDHLAKAMALQGDVRSAPMDIEVYGWNMHSNSIPTMKGPLDASDELPVGSSLLLRGRFDPFQQSELRTTVTMEVGDQEKSKYQTPEDVVSVVQLRILSNHGHPDYTCLYRFRVHGQ